MFALLFGTVLWTTLIYMYTGIKFLKPLCAHCFHKGGIACIKMDISQLS